jgi:hypothetical protein
MTFENICITSYIVGNKNRFISDIKQNPQTTITPYTIKLFINLETQYHALYRLLEIAPTRESNLSQL